MSAATAVARRPERPEDAAFRFALFAETQGGILGSLDSSMKELLLRQQFAGQTASYRAAYPQARFDIVESSGEPIGRIVSDTANDAVMLVDIALLPEWRGRGIGRRLIEALVDEAAGRRVRLSVSLRNTGARRLYERLGFIVVTADGVMATMERIARE